MATVNTVEDIIEALDANPFLLDALRARLLTRDLIELPQVVAEIAASQLRTEATLRQFMETTNARFDSVEENQKAADARFDSLKIDLDVIKGDHMELKLQGKVQSLLSERMNLRRVLIVRALFPAGNDPKFLDAVYDAEYTYIHTYINHAQ